jgi:hypothetical protein
MNMDVKDLVRNIKIKDPRSAAAVVALAVAMILFAVALTSLVTALSEMNALRADYDGALEAIEQIEALQAGGPNGMREAIASQQMQLSDLLRGYPTSDEATAEMARFYEYAGLYSAQLVRIETVRVRPEEEGDWVFGMERYLLTVRGEVPNLLAFLGHVARGPYDTFILENVRIDQESPASAEFDLYVYYSGLIRDLRTSVDSPADVDAANPAQSDDAAEPQGDTDVVPPPEALAPLWPHTDERMFAQVDAIEIGGAHDSETVPGLPGAASAMIGKEYGM